jgi:hypothetical protein
MPILAVLNVARAIFARIPWQVYAVLAVVLLLVGIHLTLQHRALERQARDFEIEKSEITKEYEDRLSLQKANFQKQIEDARAVAQAKLDEMGVELRALNETREKERREAEKRRLADLAKLKSGFANYVSPLQLSRCIDVPRGYLVRREAAAAFANGRTESAEPPASPSELDQPSGISLAAVDAIDAEAAGAYRACRDRVLEWEQWADDAERAWSQLTKILAPKRAAAP